MMTVQLVKAFLSYFFQDLQSDRLENKGVTLKVSPGIAFHLRPFKLSA